MEKEIVIVRMPLPDSVESVYIKDLGVTVVNENKKEVNKTNYI